MDGDAFIAFHGSWNRDPPTGYKVVRLPMSVGPVQGGGAGRGVRVRAWATAMAAAGKQGIAGA